MNFNGVYTAIITPFKSNGSYDEEGFQELLEKQVEAGVQGIVVLGTTGESTTITSEEKKRIIQFARKHVNSSIKLMVGTGTNSTATTIEETVMADEMGADGALVVAPYYNKPTQEGLYFHYKAITEATKLPLIIYNIYWNLGASSLKISSLHISFYKRCPN